MNKIPEPLGIKNVKLVDTPSKKKNKKKKNHMKC